jgi:hypothetical protein
MLTSDLIFYRAEEESSNPTNGGKITNTIISSGALGTIMPNATKAERDSGSEVFRKLFFKANDANNGDLTDTIRFLDVPTTADDYIVLIQGTYADTQADLTGNERVYGCAYLSNDLAIATGPVTFDVDVEHLDLATGTKAIFKVGDTCRLTTKALPTSPSGLEQDITLTVVSNVSTKVTVTTNDNIDSLFLTADGARLMPVIPKIDIATAVTGLTGKYDNVAGPIGLFNEGSFADTVTLTFTSSTNFTATSANGYVYGSGTTASDFEPVNPITGTLFFSVKALGYTTGIVNGDVIQFTVVPAYTGIWLDRVIKAGAGPLDGNNTRIGVIGESV